MCLIMGSDRVERRGRKEEGGVGEYKRKAFLAGSTSTLEVINQVVKSHSQQ